MCIRSRQWGINKSYQYSSSWEQDKRFILGGSRDIKCYFSPPYNNLSVLLIFSNYTWRNRTHFYFTIEIMCKFYTKKMGDGHKILIFFINWYSHFIIISTQDTFVPCVYRHVNSWRKKLKLWIQLYLIIIYSKYKDESNWYYLFLWKT